MEPTDLVKFYDILVIRYGCTPVISVENTKVESHGVVFCGRSGLTIETTFETGYSAEFVKDMIYLDKLKKEEEVRHCSPTVQNAYEEYQLLLKLSK